MNRESVSLIVRCQYDAQTGATRLQVVDVDTAKEMQLRDCSFLLRFSVDEGASVERCLIRHLNSGRQAYVQSGKGLQAFIKSCLLDDGEGRLH